MEIKEILAENNTLGEKIVELKDAMKEIDLSKIESELMLQLYEWEITLDDREDEYSAGKIEHDAVEIAQDNVSILREVLHADSALEDVYYNICKPLNLAHRRRKQLRSEVVRMARDGKITPDDIRGTFFATAVNPVIWMHTKKGDSNG